MHKLLWISDPAHAWLRVPYKALADAGMGVSDFSRYSFYSASEQCVWLEEDCDAAKYLARIPEAQRHNIEDVYFAMQAPVRRQNRIGDVA